MRRKTTTILAVVMTASASIACGGAAETNDPSNDQSGQQPFAGEGSKTDTGSTPSPAPGPTGAPAPTTPGAPAPAAPAACNKDALNTELSNMSLEGALSQPKHFRCLCDDKGYPLVGNINSKGATASQFCAAIKEKGQL